ncbi:MAG: HU family DNA-binding protein [Acidimicrobiia bacterium]|nr:HU family DNA-binding protein [Acidimicrobiia bacterium]
MNRRDLVQALMERLDSDRKTVEAHLNAFVDTITDAVAKGEAVAVSGFAKFARVERAARMGRNPATGEPLRIKASRKARITPLKAFKDAVLTGKAPAKKAPAKKAAAKKPAAKKPATKKAPAKKATTKKAPAKKTAAKKAGAKKTGARKTAAKKSTAARRPPARKATKATKKR